MATATSRSRPTPETTRRRFRFLPLYAGAAALLLLLVWLAQWPVGMLLAVVLAGLVVTLSVLGPERFGIGLVGLAFFLAPGGIGEPFQLVGQSVLITDAALLGGAVLLLPRLLLAHYRVAAPAVLALVVLAVTGLFSSATMADAPGASLKTLLGWFFCILVIPLILIGLSPSRRLLMGLAWCYVAGQVADTAYSLAHDPTLGIRHAGLTQHPNQFAESGLMAFALLLYLLPFTRHRRLAFAAMAVCLASVYLSGSRGATIAIALVFIAIPLVERTAVAGVLVAMAVSGGTIALAFLLPRASEDSSLARLTGDDTSRLSDDERTAGLHEGWDRFVAHPLTGDGFTALGRIHNVLLEIAVGAGVLAVLAFVLYVWSIGRPLLGASAERRLCYVVLAFAVFSQTAPAFTDRSAWLPLALGIAAFRGYPTEPEPRAAVDEPEPPTEEPSGSRSIRAMPGRVSR